jgi:Zn-dependent protease with chaperone function
MRWLAVTILGLTLATGVRADDIVDVLRRSQQLRLEAMAPADDSRRAQVVQQSVEVLRAALGPLPPIDFHVIRGQTIAETLHGHIVVANQSLADLPEGERLFVLAHEIGHVQQHHWLQMGLVYKRWVPGEVTPENTDPIAGMLGREASGLAHRQEFEADAFALQTLRRLGLSSDVAFSSLRMLGLQQDSATHPGTRKRLASLRESPGTD